MTERRRGITVRTRILAWTLLVVALALGVIVLATGRVLMSRVEANAVTELEHEAEKLRAFATGVDPSTGNGFTDPQQLLTAYLSHNVPEQDETYFSVVHGRADRRSADTPPARLDVDEEFITGVSALDAPKSGRVATSAGSAMYAAMPVAFTGDSTTGSLIVVEFLEPEEQEVHSTIITMSVAAVFSLILAGAAGWFVAGRALTPIREVQETAAGIDGSDLDRRIDVVGTDDVAQLAVTFNGMLDRVQSAFDGQRRFLDDAGHELRTPITVIRGHLELMGYDAADREQTLRLVDDELQRMSRLVDDLILLARAERPDFLLIDTVDVADLVVETLAKGSALAARTWSIDEIPEGLVQADGQRLTQALLQLIANAVAHTSDGDPIAIGGRIEHDHLLLWVRDGGVGVPHAEQPHIFERFTRGSSGERRPGSGLGLAIVARIAEAHGGTVRVDSRPGHGATFTLDLPAPTHKESP
ncbi:HAMP domain-containing sensor histidine kinase [Microbacterium sp. H1-D42]|uniref:sensor histidine kinase n=1 Tax=Microbacterium sp. H1-D42 TaxID=2925844 RepID=UPI001F52E343|nr:HAMP domain-containing sensor histidine kinase [Microbacterium sp. H1-D42]UNK72193.1 HAMP domain-containing histidine kinase [Microbacterium sp. H1-D42]